LATKESGTVLIVGRGPNEVNLPIVQSAIREVNILGSFRYCNCFPLFIALVSSKKSKFEAIDYTQVYIRSNFGRIQYYI
jgi:L-iditol 2-dehydrogenase